MHSNQTRRPVRERLLNLTLLLVSLSVSALLVEAGLRAFGYEANARYVSYLGRQQIAKPLPGLPYLYGAHADFSQTWPSDPRGAFDGGRIDYRLNNFGFRDRDFSLARGKALRVAILGDSFCWGNGVRGKDIFPAKIEAALRKDLARRVAPDRAAPDKALDVEIYNFCLAGYGSEHEAALYEQVVRHFRPDLLLVSFFLNDANPPAEEQNFDWQKVGGGDWWSAWRRRSRLVDLLISPINRRVNHSSLRRQVKAAYTKGHPGYFSITRGLRQISARATADGVPTLLTIFPWLYDLDAASYPFSEAHKATAELARQEGFAVFDLLPAFLGQAANELWVHPVDQHPNEVAHAIAARAITAFLKVEIEAGGEALLRQAEARRQEPLELPATAPARPWHEAFQSQTIRQTGKDLGKTPNILFLLADDLGYGDLGVYGNAAIRTPNLDRLASEGLRFTQFYSNGATCTPTRTALLTGCYPQRFGFRKGLRAKSRRGLAANPPTLPSMLVDSGYVAAHIGKWHLGHSSEDYDPLAKGYESFFGFLHTFDLPKTYRHPRLKWNRQPYKQQQGHLTDLLTAEAQAFLRRQASPGPPFFLSLWYFNPHTPHQPPKRWAKRYEKTPLGRYQALVSSLDENVGSLLQTLEDTGLADNTLVIFASDNGGVGEPFLPRESNGPFRGKKNQLWEGGIRVPLIVRWPGHTLAGTINHQLAVGFDWVPTLIAIAGLDRADRNPADLDSACLKPADLASGSRSLLPALLGQDSSTTQRYLFWEDFKRDTLLPRFVVRDGRWKLLVDADGAHLHNLDEDPGERRNLATNHAERVTTMTEAHRRWRLGVSEIPIDGLLPDAHDGGFTFAAELCPDASNDDILARVGDSWSLSRQASGHLHLTTGRPGVAGAILLADRAIAVGDCAQIALTFLHPGAQGKLARGHLRLYVDGELVAADDHVKPLLPPGGNTLETSHGIRQARFFSTALSKAEIDTVFRAPEPAG